MLPFYPCPYGGPSIFVTVGSFIMLDQLVAGSIMVRHMKLILVLSLPLAVYYLMRCTHNTFQRVIMTSFGGRCPHFWLCLLLTWQDLQLLMYLQMAVHIPFQYIRISSSLQDASAQGVGGNGGTNWLPCALEMMEGSLSPSLYQWWHWYLASWPQPHHWQNNWQNFQTCLNNSGLK